MPGRLGGGAAPTAAEREFSAGEALLRQGDTAGATARFEAARRLDPRDPRPPYYLGEVSRRAERWTEAEALFREAVRLRATMAEAHASLGAVLREEGRLPDAIASLEAALRLSSTLGEAHYNLGLCLEDQGDLPRAINEYRRAMQQLASDPMPALNLALALASQPAPSPAQRSQGLDALREAVRRGAPRATCSPPRGLRSGSSARRARRPRRSSARGRWALLPRPFSVSSRRRSGSRETAPRRSAGWARPSRRHPATRR